MALQAKPDHEIPHGAVEGVARLAALAAEAGLRA
jgi:hypothetical protein